MKQVKKMVGLMLCAAMILSTVVIPADANAAAKIKLSAKSATLTVGKTKTLTLKKGSKKVKGVKWKTSNKKVATVSSSGKIKAKKAGKANITATYKKKKYVCKVTVKAKKATSNTNNNSNNNTNNNSNNNTNNNNNSNSDSSTKAPVYAISQTSVSVEIENSTKLTVTKDGSTVSSGITWSSSNTKIVTVSYGTVKAIAPGTATVTATIGGNVLTCNVTVTVPDYQMSESSIQLDTADKSMNTYQLEVMNGFFSVDGAAWSTSDANVATVDEDGLVTATGAGTATITAKKYGKECSCTLTVEGFDIENDLEIKYDSTYIGIDFDLKKDSNGKYNETEIEELRAQGCTVDETTGKVTKNQLCETATYTFKRLPATLNEIKSLFNNPEPNDTVDTKTDGSKLNYGGFNAMAATVCAACSYDGLPNPADPLGSKEPIRDMFEYINGPSSKYNIAQSALDTAIRSIKDAVQISGPNAYKSYFVGAKPTNNYTPDSPYVLQMYKGPYFIDQKYTITGKRPTTYMILIPGYETTCTEFKSTACEAFASDVYIDVYYSDTAERWFSYENQFEHITANKFKAVELPD